jgi:hypothetical protein
MPADRLVLGGGFTSRERELPDIGVKINGDVVNGFGRYEVRAMLVSFLSCVPCCMRVGGSLSLARAAGSGPG